MLEDIKQSCTIEASIIPNWQKTSVNVLANAYIDNEDNEELKSAYFSAILLKKWPYIGKHYTNSKASGFSIEDCYDMVVHGIQYALEKRKWRDPENKLYNDKCAPDKILNRCIASSRDIQYYLSNTGKRRGNYGKISLDYISEEVKDCCDILSDESESDDNYKEKLSVKSLLENLIKKNKLIEALVVSSILQDDCFVEKSENQEFMYEEELVKGKRYSKTFKAGKLVDNLYNYRDQKINYLKDNYSIDEDDLKVFADNFTAIDKSKMNRLVKSVLKSLSRDEDIKDYLCL